MRPERQKLILSCLLYFSSFYLPIFSATSHAVRMDNTLGYIAVFPASRGWHIPPSFTQYRIGRNNWEIGFFDDGGFGVTRLWRNNDAAYVTTGLTFGNLDTVGFIAGAGLAYKILPLLHLRVELYSTVTAKAVVGGTGLFGLELSL